MERHADTVRSDAGVPLRDYEHLTAQAQRSGDRSAAMQAVVDLLWEHLCPRGVSWLGFYLPDGRGQLILGPRRNKPACSPIGLHGACGQAFVSGKPLIVRDVRDLGPNYVACDPRDQSELVLPLFDDDGQSWAVFDMDSHELAAFEESDLEGTRAVLRAAGLTSR